MLSDADRQYIKERLEGPVKPDCSPMPAPTPIRWPVPKEVKDELKRRKEIAARRYAGGVRVVIDGVPCKLPRKPVELKSMPSRRFKQCKYESTCVFSGWLAGLIRQPYDARKPETRPNKWFFMIKGKRDPRAFDSEEEAYIALAAAL